MTLQHNMLPGCGVYVWKCLTINTLHPPQYPFKEKIYILGEKMESRTLRDVDISPFSLQNYQFWSETSLGNVQILHTDLHHASPCNLANEAPGWSLHRKSVACQHHQQIPQDRWRLLPPLMVWQRNEKTEQIKKKRWLTEKDFKAISW